MSILPRYTRAQGLQISIRKDDGQNHRYSPEPKRFGVLVSPTDIADLLPAFSASRRQEAFKVVEYHRQQTNLRFRIHTRSRRPYELT